MKLGERLKGLLPLAGQVLGTVHPLAGMALRGVASALGVDPESPDVEDQIASRIDHATPEQLLALRQADNEFKLAMAELGYTPDRLRNELAEIDRKDRDSARKLATNTSIAPQVVLSVVYTAGYFVLLIGLLRGWLVIPEESKALIAGVIGVLTAAQTQILNFWFGSSSGSKEKTAKLGATS